MATITYPGVVSGLVSLGSTVTGIKGSYGGITFREQLTEAILPCLIVLPNQGQIQRFGAMGTNGKITTRLVHALYYWPKDKVRKALPETLPALDTLLWNYAQALKALPFLTAATAPSIYQPASPNFTIGEIKWQGKVYDGIQFTYDVEIFY